MPRDRSTWLWILAVAVLYTAATLLAAHRENPRLDRAMQLAINLTQGRFDISPQTGAYDIVTIDGRLYQAISPLPIVPYLALVPFPALWTAAHWITSAGLGIVAGWLALPVARRYGPPGPAAYWLAILMAFGTLAFTQAIGGSFYYLAHVEAVACMLWALLEWQGRRRGWVLGVAFGLASLARPTVILAGIPFAIALVLERRRPTVLAAYLAPIAAAVLISLAYNAVRFGSPFETGYGISHLLPALAERRAQGVFSIGHVPENLALFIGGGFDVRSQWPYVVPNQTGQSILLTSPALLAAVGARLREPMALLLWTAAILTAIPVFLYYGLGGQYTYGYRYALDFIPFLFALTALAARHRFGALEKALIVLSVGFVSYGVMWAAFH